MRRPAFAIRGQLFRREAAGVEFLRALAHAEIIHRQHVRPSEREHQIHLNRPAPDTARCRQPLDDFLVAQLRERPRFGDDALDPLLRNIAQCRYLLARQSRAAQDLVAGAQNVFWIRVILVREQRQHAAMDRLRRLAGKLLKHHRADQSAIWIVLALEFGRVGLMLLHHRRKALAQFGELNLSVAHLEPQ
jgi:hypothetical protein